MPSFCATLNMRKRPGYPAKAWLTPRSMPVFVAFGPYILDLANEPPYQFIARRATRAGDRFVGCG